MRYASLVFSVATLITPGLSAGVRQVVDLAFPHAGVSEVKVAWGADYGHPIIFAGDINGDGFDDVLFRRPVLAPGPIYTILIYGQAATPTSLNFEALRKTFFRHGGGEDGGIYPYGNPPYSAAGDVDGDGYDDFLFGASNADWNGWSRSGIVLLIFGAETYPDEVDLEAPEQSGLRVLRFVPEGPNFGTGFSHGSIGDMNADGVVDIAIGATGAPREVGGAPGAGRVYVVFGGWDPQASEIILGNVGRGVPGSIIRGITASEEPNELGDALGGVLSPGGDLNGDGIDDLLVVAELRGNEQDSTPDLLGCLGF